MKRNIKDYFLITLKGIAMGAADVVPGVSGGTIAFITGIYEELIDTINKIDFSVFKTVKQKGIKYTWHSINGNFLTALFLGIAISILSLAKGIKWMLHNEPILLWSFFFGLVLASIFYVGKQIKTFNFNIIIAIILSSIASYFLTLAEPFTSPESPLYLLFCGFVAIIAMILPGVSGAFILLILGAYQTTIDTINDLAQGLLTKDFNLFKEAFINFLMLAVGAILGLKIFSKILNWLFKNYKDLTLAMLTGFMIGSLNKIWPWKKILTWRVNSKGFSVPLTEQSILPTNVKGDNQFTLALVLITIGFVVILLLEKFGPENEK
jgi:putative membrane protein